MADFLSNSSLTVITGIAAGVLTAASMMPQVFKTMKTKKAENVSPLMLIILISGVMLWIVYGVLKKDIPIICTNSFSLLVNLTMFYLQWKFGENKMNG